MGTCRVVLVMTVGFCFSAFLVADEPKSDSNSSKSTVPMAQPDQALELSFQQGVHGYSGTVDTEIWALATKTILDENPNASSDANNDGGESQVVMRFDNIFGNGERQIPFGSTVVSAKLVVAAFDQGSTVNLHRMLVPFGKRATWDSLISGVSADGFEASRHKDGFTFGKIAASTSGAIFDVTDTLQIWSFAAQQSSIARARAGSHTTLDRRRTPREEQFGLSRHQCQSRFGSYRNKRNGYCSN
jgi:hypothetical protein